MSTSTELFKKDYIEELKKENPQALYTILREEKSNGQIAYVLEHLGRLPPNFDGSVFLPLLRNNEDRIRLLAVKNIGKLANDNYIEELYPIAKYDKNSMVRREAVSSIGRMRSRKAIPLLFEVLHDNDPKVALQAIRALLVFKFDPSVKTALAELKFHPNETIQYIIDKEFHSAPISSVSTMKHTESPGFMKNVIVHGDVREILKFVPDESIHLTFTSPPYYNARDYSTYRSYKDYLLFLDTVFKEVYRVTKEGRFFILNTSPVIVPRFSRQHSSRRYPIPFDIHYYLIQMGWEFVDDIIWEKPEASSKNRNAGFLQHRKPLAYKPNPVTEYVMVYRKKTDKLIDWCMRQYDPQIVSKSKVLTEYESSNVWHIDPIFDRHHSAVFPLELCDRVIKFYSYIGDLIFDPFAGSGTLGRAAINLERHFFLAEQEGRYIDLMSRDIVEKSLFVTPKPRILTIEEFRKISRQGI